MIRKLLHLLDRKQKLKTLGILVLMILGAGFEVVGISLVMPFMALIQDPTMIHKFRLGYLITNYISTNIHGMVIIAGILLLTLFLVKNSYLSFMYYAQFRFIYSLEVLMSQSLLKSYLYRPYTFHLQKNTAELLRNLTIEILAVFNQVLIPLLILLSEIMVVSVMMGVLFFMDPVIAGLASAILGSLGYVFFRTIRKKIGHIGKKHQHYHEQIIKWINQSLGGIKETIILKREDFFVQSFSKNMYELSRTQFYPQVINQLPRLFIETLMITLLTVVILIFQIRGQSLASMIPTLTLFALAGFRLMPSVNRILSTLTTIRYFKSSVDVVYQDLKNSLIQQEPLPQKNQERFPFYKAIEIKNVSYQYPESVRFILKNISLTIHRGESVAFVGPTGSGKTTLIDLILGLLIPTTGKICIDGRDLHQNLGAWQRTIGYIPQSIYLIDDTILRNVALGIPDDQINEANVWKALKIAQLEKFVCALPEQAQTQVGERGIRFSGGERQRIGIARALYHDPEIIVMDEATSSLDNDTEFEITKAINYLSSYKTLIMIAHRLTTVQNCSSIYQISEGHLVGKVNYQDLMTPSYQLSQQRQGEGL